MLTRGHREGEGGDGALVTLYLMRLFVRDLRPASMVRLESLFDTPWY